MADNILHLEDNMDLLLFIFRAAFQISHTVLHTCNWRNCVLTQFVIREICWIIIFFHDSLNKH